MDLTAVPPREPQKEPAERRRFGERLKRMLLGKPRDPMDVSIFHKLSLIAFLAWVGLGADGLSSSSYGPEEAFRTLATHTYLAVPLALLMAGTVLLISAAYSRIIEQFPHGGGGYLVSTKLLGERAGVVSGSALLIDYVLTITVSIAAAGDALFSILPPELHGLKFAVEIFGIILLLLLNIRGVRESVLPLVPVFILFLITHAVLIIGGIVKNAAALPATVQSVTGGFHQGLGTLGLGGMLLLFLHAFSLGGGTYTGIEAVSNGISIMRKPRAETAKRTMRYMAISLAFTAAGLLINYLLAGVTPVAGKTMNAVLAERLAAGFPLGSLFVTLTLVAEGAILFAAAQAGFIDGPRVLANMAVDSWVPHRFAALSERLTTQNGIVLMGLAALAALFYTHGDVRQIVIMYSINVFITFSLSMLGMLRHSVQSRAEHPDWKSRTLLFGTGFIVCATILAITAIEKFTEGGWITLLATGGLVWLCFHIRRHYRKVTREVGKVAPILEEVPLQEGAIVAEPDKAQSVAVVLVTAYNPLGIETLLEIKKSFPGQFKGLVFASVGVVDSGAFKGKKALAALRTSTEQSLREYVQLATKLGYPATARMTTGTDAVDELEKLCISIAKEFPKAMFFAGTVVFDQDRWYHRILHNDTPTALQHRLERRGITMVVLPAKIEE